jgi:hypothetical protein
MSLLTCPNCDKINDTSLTPFHVADQPDLGRITVFHCSCSAHFREQIVAGIPVLRQRSTNAPLQD